MGNTIIVNTGEVKTGGNMDILKSSPIGSCVVVILFHEKIAKGGMAHIMLPGNALPSVESVKATRYAVNALEALFEQLAFTGINKNELNSVIVGGGNVLKREGDTIGLDNMNSVIQILGDHKIKIKARSVLGTERKLTRFDIMKGLIYVTEGDQNEKILYQLRNKPHLIA